MRIEPVRLREDPTRRNQFQNLVEFKQRSIRIQATLLTNLGRNPRSRVIVNIGVESIDLDS